MQTVNIPIDDIKVINRLRKVDEGKVKDIAQSIKEIDLLHPLQVTSRGSDYILTSGNHRYRAMKLLERPTVPCVVREPDATLNQLIEVEENLCSKRLNAIQEAQHIVLREQLLIKLGRKAVVGSNQYSGEGITNSELAAQLGISRRIYSYKKQINNLEPEVQEILGETKFAERMMDMVKLTKQPKHIQLEVARLLVEGEAKTFKRAMILANLKYKKREWKQEYKKIRDELQTPKSIMRFGRKQDHLNDLCLLVSHNEKLRKTKRKALFGTSEITNYTMLPEHSRWFIRYYTKENFLCVDNTCGRGTKLIAAALEGRSKIGYALNKDNLESIKDA